MLTFNYFKKLRRQYLSGDDVVQAVKAIRRALLRELLEADDRFFKKVRNVQKTKKYEFL